MSSLYDQVLTKQIQQPILHEDDKCMAFDEFTQTSVAPVYFVVVAKDSQKWSSLSKSEASDDEKSAIMGHLLVTAKKVAE